MPDSLEVKMQFHTIRRALPVIAFLALVAVAIVYLNGVSGSEDGPLSASGTVEAVEVTVMSEVAGRAIEILVAEGDEVEEGDPLVILDDELLNAQKESVLAAIESAEAGLHTAHINLEAAQIQYQMTQHAAQLEDMPLRLEAWREASPSEFSLPVWYFEREEAIVAAEHEVVAAQEAFEVERANLKDVLKDATHADLVEAEARLADARAAFLVAEEVQDRARRAYDDQELEDYAEEQYQAAEDELDAAQSHYDQLISEDAYEDVLKARARVAVARERLDTALDHLIQMKTGDHSLQLRAAEVALMQAEALVAQAEATLEQAQTELTIIDLQQAKLTLSAPISGVIASRNLEIGEILWAGATALEIYQLDTLTITVYVQEDRYGEINLGQKVVVEVDSFPDEIFSATVVRIADRAEYTPRNVQTEEGRRTTVFAVELSIDDPSSKLKPGMPTDVVFGD
jgi:HlyD family secretion protein